MGLSGLVPKLWFPSSRHAEISASIGLSSCHSRRPSVGHQKVIMLPKLSTEENFSMSRLIVFNETFTPLFSMRPLPRCFQ